MSKIQPPSEEEMHQLKQDMSHQVVGARAALRGDEQALQEWREKREQENVDT